MRNMKIRRRIWRALKSTPVDELGGAREVSGSHPLHIMYVCRITFAEVKRFFFPLSQFIHVCRSTPNILGNIVLHNQQACRPVLWLCFRGGSPAPLSPVKMRHRNQHGVGQPVSKKAGRSSNLTSGACLVFRSVDSRTLTQILLRPLAVPPRSHVRVSGDGNSCVINPHRGLPWVGKSEHYFFQIQLSGFLKDFFIVVKHNNNNSRVQHDPHSRAKTRKMKMSHF